VYAFCDSAGKVLELKFALDFLDGETKFQTIYKKEFPAANLLTADTRWQTSPIGVFFFTSGDKIYRYNPLNGEVKTLTSDFGGKAVTMIKVIEDGNKLIAGTEGSVYTLDISTGKYGDILQKKDGIPGKIIDIVVR
jgi:outer membrane protein assembly factor BamB